jgi:MYXO-CTERM domain-containing protein
MRNLMTASLALAGLVASGVVMADEPTTLGDLVTSTDELGVTADGRLVADDISISQMVADAASGSGDGDGDGDDTTDDDSGDTGGDKDGCNCSTSANGGLGALALLLPVGLVATRRRS